jgi:hypothetical protein
MGQKKKELEKQKLASVFIHICNTLWSFSLSLFSDLSDYYCCYYCCILLLSNIVIMILLYTIINLVFDFTRHTYTNYVVTTWFCFIYSSNCRQILQKPLTWLHWQRSNVGSFGWICPNMIRFLRQNWSISSDRSIWQGDIMSPLFLNIIVDSIFRELDWQISEPSSIVGISYADDIRIASLYHDLLHHALDILLSLFARIGGLFPNVEKTKAMICLGHRHSQSFFLQAPIWYESAISHI